ncbi:MAG TPA: DUF4397 domain-containing protein [Flavipsychrobacter sp.]
MKKLLLTITSGMLMTAAMSQTARVQIIHNCADAVADEVDVYLDGSLLLNDFAFRTATAFVDVTAGTPIRVAIAPKTSTSEADSIFTLTTTLTANNTYIAVANGIVSSSGYSPAPDFGLDIYAMGREVAGNGANTDLLVVHGSTDAPVVDVRSGIETLVDDVAYGDFSNGYLELPTADYTIRLTNTTGAQTVQTYSAPLNSLSLTGAAAVVVASGFLDPAANSNGPAFGLYVALATGGALVPLPTTAPEALARAQAIHNCADAAAATVDVYVNGNLAIDNFAFRTATGFLDLPANVQLNIGIAPANSMSVTDTIYNLSATLDSAETYVIVANGIVSPMGYNPAPAFRLSVFGGARETANTGANTDVLVMHGSTDAPTVDVQAGGNTLVNDIAFGSFANAYLELPTNNYVLDITDQAGTTKVASYSANLQSLNLGGAAITVLASGFLNPANNSNGPAFGLYAATATGGNLVMLPVYTSISNISKERSEIQVWPNPANGIVNIKSDFTERTGRMTITDISGRTISQTNYKPTFDVSALSSGVYLLTIEDDSHIATQIITKQ